jgi:hypothetical protein
MEIHKPKAAHSIREFLIEIGTIICGILIALGLEQAVEAAHWAHKVETVQHGLDHQLTIDAQYAFQLHFMKACADQSMDVMEQALLQGRPDLLNTIYAVGNEGNPFDPKAWQASAWDTAQTGDVVSHLGQDRSEQYARNFRFVATERELQWKLQDDYADVMSARYGSDAASRPDRLAALERYRQTGLTAYRVAGAYLDAAAEIGVRPTEEAMQRSQQSAKACMARISAAHTLGAAPRH